MQTFLPYADFAQSAAVLDWRRLGKQRVEGIQLLSSLLGTPTNGWKNHPAREMWRGHEFELAQYIRVICLEWRKRGYKDTCLEKTNALSGSLPAKGMPWWLGQEEFHSSHRSNLLRKNTEHYGKFGWSEPPSLPYLWPVIDGSFRAKHSILSIYKT